VVNESDKSDGLDNGCSQNGCSQNASHVFVWNYYRGVPFQHHGVDMGDGTVIHFCDSKGLVAGPGLDASRFTVRRTPIEIFSPRGREFVHVIKHSRSLADDQIRRRALRMLESGRYDLFNRNCEHFAAWCVTGRHHSRQVSVAAERLSAVGTKASLAASLTVASRIGIRSLIATTKAARSIRRAATPWMLVPDALQWSTEAFGHHVGITDPKKRTMAGRAVGGVSAAAIGAAGGPLGIAISLGVWAAGESAAIGVERCSR
jgi:hypothetical protein